MSPEAQQETPPKSVSAQEHPSECLSELPKVQIVTQRVSPVPEHPESPPQADQEDCRALQRALAEEFNRLLPHCSFQAPCFDQLVKQLGKEWNGREEHRTGTWSTSIFPDLTPGSESWFEETRREHMLLQILTEERRLWLSFEIRMEINALFDHSTKGPCRAEISISITKVPEVARGLPQY